jgi:hypothetical protein
MECRQRSGVAELTEYRIERPDTATCRSRDMIHPDRNGGIRPHKFFRAPHIGRNRTEPPSFQPFQVIVRNAAKHQGHHQIGQLRQCHRVVGHPVSPPHLAHQKIDLAS